VIAAVALAASLAAGVAFESGSVDDVMARARNDGRRVVVFVHASWCGPCKRMIADLWSTPEGEALFKNVHVMTLDPDRSPDDRYCDAWSVHAYPTLIVLRPDGSEVDRILGYSGRRDYSVRVASLLKPELTLDQLQQKRSKTTDAAAAAALDVDIARALAKQHAKESEALLLEVASQEVPAAADALFRLALARERSDGALAARNLWRELAMRFPDSPHAPFAENSYAELLRVKYPGKSGDDLGFTFLRRRASLGGDLTGERVQNLVAFAAAHDIHKELARAEIDLALGKGLLDKSDADALGKKLKR
jgi:thiol-disulfide isomerase/thioredoxin